MNARTEEIPISQITKDVIKSIGEELAKFSVGFVKLEQARQGEDATLAGSGTFVKAGEVYAILTAHHVIAELPRKGPLGLILSRQLPRHVVNVCDLERVEIARGSVDTEGPDIAALICSPNISGSLEARKSFFNLTSHRDQMLREPPGINEGIWILLGFVHQLSTEEAGTGMYSKVIKFVEAALGCVVNRSITLGEHDYFCVPMSFNGRPEVPQNFQGMSGGGFVAGLVGEGCRGTATFEATASVWVGVLSGASPGNSFFGSMSRSPKHLRNGVKGAYPQEG